MGFLDSLDVQPGTVGHYELPVGQTPLGDFTLPLTIIKGAAPGPTVGITSGVHACEYNGIVTCITLPDRVNATELSGTIVMVPVVNPRSFETRTPFINVLDYQNVNRMFPGRQYGSISEQIALRIHEEISVKSDVYFDLHSGDLYEAIPLHVGCQRVGNAAVDRESETIARLFEIELVNIMGKGIDDATATVDEQGTYFAGLQSGITSVGSAALKGIPSVLLEAGGAGTVSQDVVEMEIRGLLNVFRYLGMLDGEPDRSIEHTDCYGMYILKSKYGGIFFPQVAPGDFVKEGDRIGDMRSLRGEQLATFTSPMNGVVLMMYTTPVRTSGETLLILGRIDE